MEVEQVAGNIGAEIRGVDLADDVDDELAERLLDELTRHRVLFFRGQRLDDDSQVAFTARLGPLTTAHPTVPGRRPDRRVLDVDGANGGRANSWHTDVTFVDRPPAASVLRALVLPPVGGDTVWANTALAYRSLPEHLRRLADELWAVHTNAFDYADARARQGDEQKRRYVETFTATTFETVHPVVRVHPRSSEPSLLLGTFARHLVDLPAADSAELLRLLQAHVVRLEHTVRWHWQPGDVAIWDNQATQHYAIADYGDAPRHMARVTLAGEAPVALDGRRGWSIRGDSTPYLA